MALGRSGIDVSGANGGGNSGGSGTLLELPPIGSAPLASAVTEGSITAIVASNKVKYPTLYPFFVRIDDEVVQVTAGVGSPASPFIIVRAQNGTVAALHSIGAAVKCCDFNPITGVNKQASDTRDTGGAGIILLPGIAGEEPWLAGTDYQSLSGVDPGNNGFSTPSNTSIVLSPSVVITALMSGARTANTTFGGVRTVVGSTTTTVQNVIGASQFTVASAAQITPQSILLVTTNGEQRGNQYRITSIVGNVVSVDRPILFVFPVGSRVEIDSAVPSHISIDGQGALFTGTAASAMHWPTAYRVLIANCRSNDAAGNYGAGFHFDIGSLECTGVNMRVRSPAGTTLQALFFESCESCGWINCASSGADSGFSMNDCVDCSIEGGTHSGGTFGHRQISTGGGCLRCEVKGLNVTGAQKGFLITAGAVDAILIGCTATACTQIGLDTDVNGGASGQVVGGSYTNNTGAGIYVRSGNALWSISSVDVSNNGNAGIENDGSTGMVVMGAKCSGGTPFPLSFAGPGKFDVIGCDLTTSAGADSAIDVESGAEVTVQGGTIRITNTPASGAFSLVGANSKIDVRGVKFTGGALGTCTAFKTTDITQEVRRALDVDVSAFSTAFAGAALRNWGSFVLNGATPVNTAVACKPGDTPALVRSANGGTPGLTPLIVTTLNQIAATGVVLDTSTYTFSFPS